MHPVAVHAIATARAEQLQQEAAAWRRSRSQQASRASRLPARLRTVRLDRSRTEVAR